MKLCFFPAPVLNSYRLFVNVHNCILSQENVSPLPICPKFLISVSSEIQKIRNEHHKEFLLQEFALGINTV